MNQAAPYGREWSATLALGADSELRGWLDLALEISDETDGIARRDAGRTKQVDWHGPSSLVTETDLEIETRFRERISGRHPEHGIIGEEYGEDRPDASVRWFIDPIDGTRDLIDGVPLYATLVAVERDGELQVGFVSLPGLGERWFAWRGGGAWNGSRSIRVSEVGALSSSRLLYYSLAEMRASPVAAGFDALVARVLSDRAPGSVWSDMLVAQGAAEAAIELDLDPWDVAASLVIVEEAGGRATDLGGVRTIHGGNFVASNGRVHDPILGILGRSGE